MAGRKSQKEARPSFEEIYMLLARALSARSTCARAKVGCAIVSRDFRQVLAVGYNGNAAGLKNDCDRHGKAAVGNCGCIHAEANAIVNCSAPRSVGKIVFASTLPCVACAKMLVNLGGVAVVNYAKKYRTDESTSLLIRCGIAVREVGEVTSPLLGKVFQ